MDDGSGDEVDGEHESPIALWDILDKTWLKARKNVDEYWKRKVRAPLCFQNVGVFYCFILHVVYICRLFFILLRADDPLANY